MAELIYSISDYPDGDFAGLDGPPVVTGSFAATNDVAVAASTQLAVYVKPPRDADRVAEQLGLLPADEGGDVVLLLPPNPGVVDWAVQDPRGFLWAARSQVAVDCLSGPGRMPAEGDALLGWMVDNEREWRREDLEDLGHPGGWRTDGRGFRRRSSRPAAVASVAAAAPSWEHRP